jgi:hypothetical protein
LWIGKGFKIESLGDIGSGESSGVDESDVCDEGNKNGSLVNFH